MVARRLWLSRVFDKELAAITRINELNLHEGSQPVNLENLIQQLGLQIRKCSLPEGRLGSLTRYATQWTIHIPLRPQRTLAETRFTIAHEVAHMLLSEAGLDTPVSEEEYWTLESACDRVASSLLVPESNRFSTHLSPKDVPKQFEELCNKWLLPSHMAARFMCDYSVNLFSAMSVRRIDDMHLEKSWDVVGQKCPRPYEWDSYVNSSPFVSLCQDLFHTSSDLVCDYWNGVIIVGVKDCRRVNDGQLELDLPTPYRSSEVSSSSDTVVLFHLSEPTCDGQVKLFA